jgi:hypothetical protein
MPASEAPVATRVMTTCPAEDAAVFTGHRMRPAELESLREPRSFRCGRCEKVHSWTAETAWCEAHPRFG